MGKQMTNLLYFISISILTVCLTEIDCAAITFFNTTEKSLCPTILQNSSFIEPCINRHPLSSEIRSYDRVESLLCLGVFNTWQKLCFYGSKNLFKTPNMFNDHSRFDAYVTKTDFTVEKEKEVCENLTKWEPFEPENSKEFLLELQELLKTNCNSICHSFIKNDKFNPLCQVLMLSLELELLHNKNSEQPVIETTSKKIVEDTNKHKNIDSTKIGGKSESNIGERQQNSDKDQNPNVNSNKNQDNKKDANVPQQHIKESVDITLSKPKSSSPEPASQSIIKKNDNKEESTTLSEKTEDVTTQSFMDDPPLDEDSFNDPEIPIQNNNMDNQNQVLPQPPEQQEINKIPHYETLDNEEESHIFTYLSLISALCIAGYFIYYNKQKILAILLEGRRSKNNRTRRRPSTANYRKLDCTLEEAVTSQCSSNVTHVIY